MRVEKQMQKLQDEVVKFASYLMSRKMTRNTRQSHLALQAIKTLAASKFFSPVSVTLANDMIITEKRPATRIRVTDLLGEEALR